LRDNWIFIELNFGLSEAINFSLASVIFSIFSSHRNFPEWKNLQWRQTYLFKWKWKSNLHGMKFFRRHRSWVQEQKYFFCVKIKFSQKSKKIYLPKAKAFLKPRSIFFVWGLNFHGMKKNLSFFSSQEHNFFCLWKFNFHRMNFFFATGKDFFVEPRIKKNNFTWKSNLHGMKF
jgi:hypothetical protein